MGMRSGGCQGSMEEDEFDRSSLCIVMFDLAPALSVILLALRLSMVLGILLTDQSVAV
jgi:hypothetical protein